MSTTPETLPPEVKPKRKYTKRAQIQPPTPQPVQTSISAQAPSHAFEHFCTVPIKSFLREAMNGDKVKAFEYCDHEAKWVPTIHMHGNRMDPDPNNPKKLISTSTKVATRFGPVCEEHKAKIEQNILVLISGQELDNLSGEYYKEGFGTPDKTKTKITWAEFEVPETDLSSDHIRALQEN